MNTETDSIRLFGTVEDSIVDGPGLRFAIFVQGCVHNCPGCHNPESQSFSGGYDETIDAILQSIAQSPLTQGITLSGGEPFCQAQALIPLVEAIRLQYPAYSIWIYSGYTYEELLAGKPNAFAPELLNICDVLVDGLFIQDLHSYDLLWKGSSNQRIIDIAKSREAQSIVLWREKTEPEDNFKLPSSW